MNRLDRMIKRERKSRYKYLKKLFKARDMASKHVKKPIPVSQVEKWFSKFEVDCMFTSTLAKSIVGGHLKWMKPPPPPPQNAKRSISPPKPPAIREVR